MSLRYLGGIIKPSYNPLAANVTVSPTVVQTGGVYTIQQQAQAQGQQQWSHDPYFNNTTLLLHADNFANGSQNNTFLTTPPGGVGQYSGFINGTGKSLTLTATSALSFSGDLTVEAWLYLTSYAGSSYNECTLLSLRTGLSTGSQFDWGRTGGSIAAGAVDWWNYGSVVAAGSAGDIPLNQWAHVAYVRSGSSTNNCKIYVNGVLKAQGTYTGTVGVSSGTCYIGNSMYDQPMNGYVSNLRVTNTAVYTAAFTPPTSTLTAISGTQLLTCQSATFVDNSPNNFTLTNNGSNTIVNPNSFPAITRNGTPTQGTFTPYGDVWSVYNTDAADNGFGVGANAALNMGTGDFTVEAWVNTAKLPTTNSFQTTSGGYQFIFATGVTNTATASQLYIGVTNLKFDISTDLGGPIDVAHNMVPGQWYHVAVTRSGTTFRAFINGVLVQTATSSTSWVDGYGWGIGRGEPVGAWTGGWWYGYISNFRAVKGTALYTASFNPSTTPLTAVSGTGLLVAQSNRFKDNSANNFAISFGATAPSVQRFAPFSPSSGYSPSVYSGGGYFNGSTDYFTFTSNAPFVLGTSNWTFEAWVYITDLSSNRCLYDDRDVVGGPGPNQVVVLYVSTSGILNFFNGTNYAFNTALAKNAWYHVAYVRNGSTLSAYVNGVAEATTVNVGSLNDVANTPRIGKAFDGGPWYGYLCDVRMVNGRAVYTSNFTPPASPLTNVANTALLMSYTNAGIYDNGMQNALTTVSTAQVNTSIVKYGSGSMAFNGTSDYLSFLASQNFAMQAGSFTVEAWVYPTAFSAYRAIFDTRAATTNNTGMLLSLANASTGSWAFFKGSTLLITASTNLTLNTWQHVAVVRSGSTITLYLNGVNVGTATDAQSFTDTTCRVGATVDSIYWSGYMDDFRVTKGVARYLSNFTPPQIGMANQ